MSKATEAFRLLGAILGAMAAGVALTKTVRDLVKQVAEDEGLFEKVAAAKKKAEK